MNTSMIIHDKNTPERNSEANAQGEIETPMHKKREKM